MTILKLIFFSIFGMSIQVSLSHISYSHYRCLDTMSHKTEPGPEGELFQQCTPWKNWSCCTYNITEKAHEMNLYNFNFNHCARKKNISAECQKHFIQDLCFYECSPNIGPWIVKVKQKIRKERFFGIPLCKSECDEWFAACAEDFTCADNWVRNFNWTSGSNQCLSDAECLTFREIFKTSKAFCEKIWDNSWKVVNDSEPCMKIWFDSSKGNPNDEVANLKMAELNRFMSVFNNSGSFGNMVRAHPFILLFSLNFLL